MSKQNKHAHQATLCESRENEEKDCVLSSSRTTAAVVPARRCRCSSARKAAPRNGSPYGTPYSIIRHGCIIHKNKLYIPGNKRQACQEKQTKPYLCQYIPGRLQVSVVVLNERDCLVSASLISIVRNTQVSNGEHALVSDGEGGGQTMLASHTKEQHTERT